MKLIACLILIINFAFRLHNTDTDPHVLVLCQNYSFCKLSPSDTIYIPYDQFNSSLNDTIRKYLNGKQNFITDIIIAQPSKVIGTVNWSGYDNVHTVILAGNDDDVLDSMNYTLFDLPKLKKLIVSSVYLKTITNDDYTWNGKERFKEYIKASYPKVKVIFKPMGKYNNICWHRCY